jgi:hypothetical protein
MEIPPEQYLKNEYSISKWRKFSQENSIPFVGDGGEPA